MAKIKVLGNACTLISTLKSEDIKKATKYCPEAVTLVDEEKNPYFVVKMGEPSASKFGVSFNETNDEGKAYLTIVGIPRDAETKEIIKEDFGEMLFNLNKIETKVEAALNEINERITSIESAIEFVD